MKPRFSLSRFALGYIALGVLALAVFAVLLGYGYRTNLGTFRAYVPGAELQRLVDIFHRDGPQAVAAAVEAYLPSLPRDEIIVFADPEKRRLAGSLPAWPAEVPEVPGTYGMVIGLGEGASMRVVTSHVTLPGGYYLLMGRESVRFQSLVERFWFGIVGAMALILGLGALIARRSRRALLAQEQRYALVMNAADDGFWDWTVATDEFYASPRLLEIYGFPAGTTFAGREDFLARSPFHPEDRAKWQQAVDAHFAGRTARFDIEMRLLPGGRARSIHLTGLASRDASGVVVRWTGATRDITERKRAEEELKLSEERYARAMEGSDAGHWDWNIVTDEMFVSERAREMLALPAGAVPLRRADIMERVPMHPDDRSAMNDKVSIGIRSGLHERDYRVIASSGEVRWLRSRGKVYHDARGAAVRMTGSLTDITERKLAADALRASEGRYGLAMEASEEGFVDVNLDTGEFVTSERLNEIFGIAPGTRFRGRSDFLSRVRFYGNDGETYGQAIRAIAADGVPDRYQFEFRIVLPSGEVRWVGTRGKVMRDAEGRPRRRVGVFADITARKLAEEGLRESEERYERAMAAAEAGFWDWDVAQDKYYVSPRLLEMAGLPPGTIIAGRADFHARVPFHPEDLEKWQQAIKVLFASGGSRLSAELRVILGMQTRWYRLDGMCFRDAAGNVVRWTGSSIDVTPRKVVEEALRASEERFALAVAGSNDGLWDWDILTNEMFLSERAQRIYGLEPGRTIRPRAEWRGLVKIHPDDAAGQLRNVEDYLAGRSANYEGEWRVSHPDGRYRWIRIRGICVRDADGRPTRFAGSVSDIDERRGAEEALRRSESYLTEAMRLGRAGSFAYDVRTHLNVHWSPTTYEIFDFDPAAGLPTPEEIYRRVHPEDVESVREARGRAMNEKAGYDAHYRIVRRDGAIRHLHATGHPVLDANGEVVELVGVVTDITERKQAEAELRDSEARFRALTELSSDWYWRQDEKLRFTYVSQQVADRGKYPREWVIGKTRWELRGVTPLSSSWEEHQAVVAAARQPFREFEYARIGEDGSTEYVSISGAPIFDEAGEFRGYQGVGRSITERKRAEAELRSRQEMLELAQKAARAVAFEWRIGEGEGENRWSPDLEAMYGLAPGSYDGSYERWQELVYAEDRRAVQQAIEHAQSTGDVDAEYRVVHPDGSIHWLHAKGRMLFDAGRRPSRMVGFMHEVTQRRQAEEELKAMERKLRQAQRLEAMGTLAGGIAHDFNNILGVILGYGEMALRDAPKGSRLRRDVNNIVTAGERGRALVDRVLAFSRSGVGERSAVHVEKVTKEALDLLSAKLPRKVTLHAKLRAGAAAMLGDATQVHQVVMNLATNAIHAMPRGGELRIALDAIRLERPSVPTIGALQKGDYIVLGVGDTGTGIAPDVLERIFDPFFTTKDVGTGTGLGLSLVHGIVTEVGGAIDVASTVGAGSTFTVYLPRSGDAQEQPERDEPALPRGGGQRVLVVDDEEPLVKLATRALKDLGYAPVGFTSSAAALAAFRADPARFDAVITDERMPGMSGSTLIRRMRGIRERIPIVLMSGYLGGAVAARARAAGAEDLLQKPLSARDLAASLARVLGS